MTTLTLTMTMITMMTNDEYERRAFTTMTLTMTTETMNAKINDKYYSDL